MLRSGLLCLIAHLKQHAGEQIVYRRGAASYTITAIIGRSGTATTDASGALAVSYTDADFIIAADDLPFAPTAGDRIQRSDGSLYQVLHTSGTPGVRPSDPLGVAWRVSTKRVPA